jgi:hypothetical protein
VDGVEHFLDLVFGCLFLEKGKDLAALLGVRCLVAVVLVVGNVLLLACGNELVVWFGESLADALGEGQADLLVEYTINERLLWGKVRQFDLGNPEGMIS